MNYYKGERETSVLYADGLFYGFVRACFTAHGMLVLRLCAGSFCALCVNDCREVGSHTRTLHIGRRNYFYGVRISYTWLGIPD